MPIATNPDTGETLFLDGDQWKPAKTAVNPQTKEMLAFDGKDWKPVTTHGHGVLGYIDDAVRAIASGMSFGYADKFAAKMDELTGRGGSYEENIKKERARTENVPAAIKYPGEIAGTVIGGVAASPFTGAVGAATGLSKLPALAKAVVGGAAGGAAFGAGNADENVLGEAAGGAVVGAVGGAALHGAVKGLQHIFAPGTRANAELTRAITRDGDTIEGLQQKLQTLRQTKPDATIADVGGENVKGILERISQTPGAGRTEVVPALTERQNTELSRISQDLKDLTGTSKGAFESIEGQIEKRKTTARPLYEQAYNEGDKAIWSPELERLTGADEFVDAMHSAVKGWRRSQIAQGYGSMNPGALVERGGLIKFTNGKLPAFPNLQFWDYTKHALDDMITAEIKADGTMTKKGADLTTIVGKLRDQLDQAVPSYQAARDAWGGPSAYINGVKLGQTVFSMPADEFAAKFSRLSGADKEAARIGAVSQILQKLGNKGAKLADLTSEIRSPQMRGKISALMPNAQAAAQWHKALEFEVGSSELVGRGLKGSQTARRMLESKDADSIAGDLVMSAFAGHPPAGLFTKVLANSAGKVKDTVRSRTDKILAQKLLGGPSALQPYRGPNLGPIQP